MMEKWTNIRIFGLEMYLKWSDLGLNFKLKTRKPSSLCLWLETHQSRNLYLTHISQAKQDCGKKTSIVGMTSQGEKSHLSKSISFDDCCEVNLWDFLWFSFVFLYQNKNINKGAFLYLPQIKASLLQEASQGSCDSQHKCDDAKDGMNRNHDCTEFVGGVIAAQKYEEAKRFCQFCGYVLWVRQELTWKSLR